MFNINRNPNPTLDLKVRKNFNYTVIPSSFSLLITSPSFTPPLLFFPSSTHSLPQHLSFLTHPTHSFHALSPSPHFPFPFRPTPKRFDLERRNLVCGEQPVYRGQPHPASRNGRAPASPKFLGPVIIILYYAKRQHKNHNSKDQKYKNLGQ